jgi:hypothetical protein
MIRRPPYRMAQAVVFSLCLAACAGGPFPEGPGDIDLTQGLLPRDGATPPNEPAGACWAANVVPAVIETVTEQVQASPERRAADGSLIAPASFRTETRQRIVSDRRAVWFETLCDGDLGVDTLSTLQRALKARGLYREPLTGAMDGPTRAAIRAWQRPRGLDSDVLSLAAAQALGVVAAARPDGG